MFQVDNKWALQAEFAISFAISDGWFSLLWGKSRANKKSIVRSSLSEKWVLALKNCLFNAVVMSSGKLIVFSDYYRMLIFHRPGFA